MEIDLIAYAIPIFALLMGAEYIYSIIVRKKLYHLADFINNISCGMLEQVVSVGIKVFVVGIYAYVYSHYRLFSIPGYSLFAWFILWLLVDFCYYWLHRASHRINFLWAGHSVHHQSEQYNLSVALRQGVIQTLCTWCFYLPLAMIGFTPFMFVVMVALNTVYQFYIHTQLINKMGWLEYVFNTPSHHRVHHGKNEQYIDKNYAGSLIIWDKWFGTFEKEDESVQYGVTDPLANWNPFYANIKVLVDAFHYGKKLTSFRERILAFIKPPEWIVNKLGNAFFLMKKDKVIKSISSENTVYVIVNFIVLSFVFNAFMMQTFSFFMVGYYLFAFILLTLWLLGYVLNGGKRIFFLECVRVALLYPVIGYKVPIHWLGVVLIIAFFLVNLFVFFLFGEEEKEIPPYLGDG